MNEQYTLFPDNAEYDAFTDKFKPKKTTDDCYTPPTVYAVIRDWVCETYGVDPRQIVRPFYPGGDYVNFEYPEGCVVLDNPPFSILSQICAFYLDRGIAFFLFAPSLTCFSSRENTMRMNHIICDCNIVYENGATVRTSFVSSFGGDIVAQSAPELTQRVNNAVERMLRAKKPELPKYTYPDCVITAAMLQRYAKYGIDFAVRRRDCSPVYVLDAQRAAGKTIFGGGLFLSERAAAERAAAERALPTVWALSDREIAFVAALGQESEGADE